MKRIGLDFSKLPMLKHLDLDFADDLEEFPETIYSCTNLLSLRLSRFHRLKDYEIKDVGIFKKLKWLNISDSNFKMANMSAVLINLESLLLDGVVSIPELLFQSVSLRRLYISHAENFDYRLVNQLKGLEYLMFTYSEIKNLDLEGLNIDHLIINDCTIGTEVVNLEKLNNLEYLCLTKLVGVKQIDITKNYKLVESVINVNDDLENILIDEEKYDLLKGFQIYNNPKLNFGRNRINKVLVSTEL